MEGKLKVPRKSILPQPEWLSENKCQEMLVRKWERGTLIHSLWGSKLQELLGKISVEVS